MTAFDIQKEDIKAVIPTPKEEKSTIFRKPIKLEDLVSGVKAELQNWLLQSLVLFTASLTAVWAASSQLLSELPTSSTISPMVEAEDICVCMWDEL